jgi:ribose/xylose/arabinose/galactoside ABC-type transport system permease subunit
MTVVMVMGGIDLSVGSLIAFSTVVTARVLQAQQASGALYLDAHPLCWPLAAALAGAAACAACGVVSGLLVTGLRVVPFIVTLGMMLEVRGLAKRLAHEQKVDAPASWLSEVAAALPPERQWMLFPPAVWLLVFMAVLVAVLLHLTRLGRRIYAVGSNEQTARLCGVAVERVKVLVYTFGAACTGLAGVIQFSRLTVGDPTVAMGQELDVIAAVVIGGGSLSGGEGSVLGSLVGALFLEVIRSGCTQLGLDPWVHHVVTGGIIIAAVALDRLRHLRAET